ncbi:hypothetical protein [Blastococcus sp. PRF04-17]|uniref:hypothetical protein n=1 Tax=Blastococcus sp. PRF04-17 TaxID=2933797 RepID=UPI001FF0FEE4|nr:hypothetical protein [Blastococcus sp. PRF04-17]UOY01412.1 hypothetical protein MVA48_21105 [Blastococcus sp. PRF04-17]
MRRSLRPAALAVLLLLSACGARGTADEAPEPSSAEPAPAAGLVLRVDQTGGFVMPSAAVGRLPVVAVYADGQVITQGPVPAIHPGPALPNVQVQEIDQAQVQDVVDRALAAGVAETGDLGSPPVADAFTTRFTLVTADDTYVREVYALWETPEGGSAQGVTADQAAARDRLAELLNSLTDLGMTDTTAYEPSAVAVITAPWTDPGDGLDYPAMPWPGPELPGAPLPGPPGFSCATVTGTEVAPLLEAAAGATQLTPWTTPDGDRWSVTFRPLLPDESGCEDLTR